MKLKYMVETSPGLDFMQMKTLNNIPQILTLAFRPLFNKY